MTTAKLRGSIAALAIIAVLVTPACTVGAPAGAEARVRVAATFYPLAEFARRVGGSRADVRALVPTGVEPHDYEPTPRDLAAIERADVFVYNGAGFEPWVDRLLPELPPRVVRVNATAGLALLMPPWSSGGPDPHVWLDPVLAQAQVGLIAAGFVQADPAGRTTYEANASALRADLGALHRRYEQGLRSCRRKEFVTTHAAFGYLAARYGLHQVSIAGLQPEAEPTPARLREIVALVRRADVRVIYAETLTGSSVAEAVARETGAQVRVLNPVEGLTREERARGLDYFAVMNENFHQLAAGLDCTR